MRRFKNILVVCDEQSAYEHAFERVLWLATVNKATVTLIDVIDAAPGDLSRLFRSLPGGQAREIESKLVDVHRSRLDDLAAPLREEGIEVDTVVRQGIDFIEIIQTVLANGHDLVIKGAQRTSNGPFFRGADMHLMRKCPCPVWVLNSRSEHRSRRILAAVDPDPDDPVRDGLNRTILQLATSLAVQDESDLEVISVWRVKEESTLRHSSFIKMPAAEVDALVEEEERQSGWRLQELVGEFHQVTDKMRVLHIKGIASDIITKHVAEEGIDTIVMGTIGRTGVAGFFIGNTAETILSRVGCSVLTVKPQGFVSPVSLEAASAGAVH